MRKKILFSLLIATTVIGIAWVMLRFEIARRQRLRSQTENIVDSIALPGVDAWNAAVERIKEPRLEDNGDLVIPPELKHYSERYWFLATQVAEIEKFRVHTCQDYLDLAVVIQRGELVAVPAVTETYVQFGVGEKADESVFARFEGDRDVALYSETQLSDAYRQFAENHANVASQIASLNTQASRLGRRERSKRSELQTQISSLQQELSALNEARATLDQFYGQPETRQNLFRDYQSLQTLAQNFGGRSYNIDEPAQRHELKITMLRSLRPEALKILEQLASVYQAQFGRPLPVSSLVRPEQYQHALRKINRNAVLIDSPPHSTGLAFDIDYRYMSTSEQTFLMAELARLKIEGRIEAIRERRANYHVFTFINGIRPADDLIAASLEKAGAPAEEAHHTGNATLNSKEVKSQTNKKSGRTAVRRQRKHRH